MSPESNLPAGSPCWIELATPDIEGAKAFYAEVFGWTYGENNPEFGGYTQAEKDGQTVAGITPMMGDLTMSVWTLYFATDDIEKSAQVITEKRGTLIAPPMPIMDMGKMLIATDPAGGAFGLWEGGTFHGADLFNKPGSLTWEDLRSKNPTASRAFFTALFGYDYSPIPMEGPADYRVFTFAGSDRPLGGMGDMMGQDNLPSHWILYMSVEDASAAEASIKAAGGNVLSETMQTPFGRMCVVTDPFGATFVAIDAVKPE